ncbi:fatty acid cis/trans isomerase [Accumulibacter sp.]|uniref:fatty acid cis/trans isomerase n=2 Tax=Accumulibacter sp. TaxID=2053492 RepID=UPI002CA71F0D|nr:fatty acid cis/trans isomerase [Accumulibacter sp.]HNG15243.1 fatty acid cis/trans isomerase [Accumulibacter sp.]
MNTQRIAALLAALLVAGCTALSRDALDRQFGAADPTRHDAPLASTGEISYRRDVQPILERRCVLCHACYDAPCQQKLGAWEGIARGSSKQRVYETRLGEAPPTRLFEDARKASEWRQLGFSPVLNERQPTAEINLAGSVLYRSLQLKERHPLPQVTILPETFDFSLDRAQRCPQLAEFDSFAREHPLWGMPFGLPGLSGSEMDLIRRWLEAGAPFAGLPPLPAKVERHLAEWEAFFNGDSAKQRLVSRYLYEHLFLAHIYFDDDAQRHYFRLIRSRTPPGVAADPIATRRPYDDPGSERVYYRLQREQETIVDKTHMPYALGAQRMARWREWFLTPDYAVDQLPSYDPTVAANPFLAFRALPVSARYRFLLDEAEFTIMGFIKGPVCRGQVALDVIQDRFWVFFLADQRLPQQRDDFLARASAFLRLPAEAGSSSGIIGPWREYARLEAQYLRHKSAALSEYALAKERPTLDWIWDGDGVNPNAALTVFRHYDSASVSKGLLGEPPKTVWVLSYPLLERIHYLLVAGFDVYGNVGHQALSRLYMDFMRMEAEFNALTFLPLERRRAVRDYWYRDAGDEAKEHVYGTLARFEVDSGIRFRTQTPLTEFYAMLRTRLAPVLERQRELASVPDAGLRQDLAALAGVHGASLSWWPEVLILRVDDPPHAARYFTVLRNTGHRHVTSLLREGRELQPDENTLTVVAGILGSYPNAIFRVQRDEIGALATALRTLASENDYRALADRYAVRRTHADFWSISDALQDEHLRLAPIAGGLLDYSRLENR